MTEYILGLDLGPNSIGWALVATQLDGDRLVPTGLLDTGPAAHPPLGVRVFEAGLQNFDTGKEASRNQARRQARAARKTIARRRARKIDTLRVLQDSGLLPLNKDDLQRVFNMNPYALRARALDEPLTGEELGRALYHLAQRRGFKSNRLQADEKEEKGLLEEISRLDSAITASGSRTLGEYLNSVRTTKSGSFPVRLRARQARMDLYSDAPRRTRRSMYEVEFDAILEAQDRLNSKPLLTSDHRQQLHRALFFQHDFALSKERLEKAPSRANMHRAPGVRPCPYEKGEVGCPRSDWLAQRFRILKEVQSLRISEAHQPERPLTVEEAREAVELLSNSKESSFAALGKALAKRFKLAEPVEFNLSRGGRAKMKGNPAEAALANAFGKRAWHDKPEGEKQALRVALEEMTSSDDLDGVLQTAGLADAEKREKLGNYRPHDDGYLSFSKRALSKILPLMESGKLEHQAIAEAYPETFVADGLDELPSLVAMQIDDRVRPKIPPQTQNELTTLTNPIVRRALVEVRKVINALVRQHGKPARIVVELAREMRQGHDARQEHSRRINDRNRRREEAREELRNTTGLPHSSRADVDRWLLWGEQAHACPYCGTGIGMHEVVNADIEVDHILPRWRSLDDSLANKVLACAVCNADKGNRTPIEWLGADSPRMAMVLKRVRACVARKDNPGGMPYGKIKRFEAEHVDADRFAESQLNDTRYISKLVSHYLLLLYPAQEATGQRRILTSKGNLTAHLRRMWGLNDIIPPLVKAHGEIVPGFIQHDGWTEKLRVDHRHHAVDALVVALSSRSFVKHLQDCWRRDIDPSMREAAFEAPWSSLRSDAASAIERINVSHRPMRRLRGPLHEATYYGAIDRGRGIYVTRKRLEDLTGKMVAQVRDPVARRVIEERLRSCGWDGESNKLPKDWAQEELFLPTAAPRHGRQRRNPHPVRRVRVSVNIGQPVRLGEQGHRFAASGSNYCLQVIETNSGEQPSFRVVSRFDAHSKSGPPALAPSLRLLGTLHRKDSVLVDVAGIAAPVLGVIQSISGRGEVGSTGLEVMVRDSRDSRPSTEAKKDPLMRIKSRGRWNEAKILPVIVDPLGRIQLGPPLFRELKD